MRSGSVEIDLAVPADDAWAAIVAPGLRDWYYRLTPQGDFAEGMHITWVDIRGDLAEESDVVEVRPAAHLALRTRYVFAPNLASLEPHRAEWDITPHGLGCHVRFAWHAPEPVAAMLDAEAHSHLSGLRLAVDPAARAEVARLDSIGDIDVRDVTPDRVADYQAFFDHDAFRDFPAWQSCYCMEVHSTYSDDEWAVRTSEDNRTEMSGMIAGRKVTALLAYSDGKPVGWCNYGETTHLGGLVRRYGLEAADHDGVGSIACFVIASQYRGHGVASRLLEGAIQRLRDKGLRAVEAYPARDSSSQQSNFRGPLSMYQRAGFEPYRETERYLIVRKKF